MPKNIDPALRERAVRLMPEHRSESPSLTAASAAVARQVGVGKETVRRWVVQADIDDGARNGVNLGRTDQKPTYAVRFPAGCASTTATGTSPPSAAPISRFNNLHEYQA